MKDGIGEGYTREDHSALAAQLFASYARVQDSRALAGVIGEDECSEIDRYYISFGRLFEEYYLTQDFDVNRTIDETLDLGWYLLSLLPKSQLDRINTSIIDKYYNRTRALTHFSVLKNGKLDAILTKEQ
jgi:V/A-type H+-transporting ATPase subunit B